MLSKPFDKPTNVLTESIERMFNERNGKFVFKPMTKKSKSILDPFEITLSQRFLTNSKFSKYENREIEKNANYSLTRDVLIILRELVTNFDYLDFSNYPNIIKALRLETQLLNSDINKS